MSDVSQVPPSVARDAAAADILAAAGGAAPGDVLGALTGRVRDTAARAVVAAGRWHTSARVHPALDVADATFAEFDASRTQLCDAVSVLAAHLRRGGVPPERMLVVVKDAVRGAAAPTAADAADSRVVMSDAVRWGIDAYYATA